MTTATRQRTHAPCRCTPPLGTRHSARSGHTNGGLYAYAANSPVCYTDPDGRYAGQIFATMDETAMDFAETYNDDSIRLNAEVGAYIYRTDDGYYYGLPFTSGSSHFVKLPPEDSEQGIVSDIHTHASFETSLGEFFSFGEPGTDVWNAQTLNRMIYLVTPGGKLLRYTPSGTGDGADYGATERIADDNIPSDSNAGDSRMTSIDISSGRANYIRNITLENTQ